MVKVEHMNCRLAAALPEQTLRVSGMLAGIPPDTQEMTQRILSQTGRWLFRIGIWPNSNVLQSCCCCGSSTRGAHAAFSSLIG